MSLGRLHWPGGNKFSLSRRAIRFPALARQLEALMPHILRIAVDDTPLAWEVHWYNVAWYRCDEKEAVAWSSIGFQVRLVK